MNYKNFLEHQITCPFCDSKDRVIIESEHSFVTYALWPYHRHHLLTIPKRHVESLYDLTEIERQDIVRMQEKILEILKKLGYESITHMVREGRNNKAVNHIHFHTIPNISIGDLDHYGQERKMMSNDDISMTVKDIKKLV